MRIIFLDVDGVLNSIRKLIEVYYATGKAHSGINYPFDEVCLNNLKELVEKTGAKIVITSTWRTMEDAKKRLSEELAKYNLLKDVIGYTKIINHDRALEIKDYLDNLPFPVEYIILDDDFISKYFNKYLIKCDTLVGLTKKDTERGIKKLTKNRFARK